MATSKMSPASQLGVQASPVLWRVFVGRTRGIILHLSKYNYQRIEPSPISIQTVPFKSVASMFQVKRSRTYATTSLKILCVSFPGPAVLCSTTAREAGTHREPTNHCFWKTVPLSPPPSPDKKKKMYLILLVLSGV